MTVRVRFAPSPSGYLHIGGARTALFGWLWAKSQGGQFLLRIEDTDQERSSEESVRAVLDALRWLGLDWDEGPGVGGPHAPYFQSERRELYRKAAERLVDEGKAYRCYATKEELDQARAELKAKDPKAQFVYPRWWRDRKDRPELPYVIRFKSPLDGTTDFVDKVFGRISTPNKELQDFVIMRSDGFPLYNLGAVVDDHAMGITLVGRGREHTINTPPQVLLYQAFEWEVPEFAHLPLMLAPDGAKLSKRNASVAVHEYRDKGYTPLSVLNYLVRFGWSYGDQEIFTRQELIDLFNWDRVSRSDGKFDDKKFADVAFEHLKRPELTSTADYIAGVRPRLAARGLDNLQTETLAAAIATVRERARTLEEAALALDYYFREPPEMDEKARLKFLVPAVAPHLQGLASALEAAPNWDATSLENRFREWLEQQGLSLKDVAQAARVAVTGRTASPPLFEVMTVLGRERSLGRLAAAAKLAAGG